MTFRGLITDLRWTNVAMMSVYISSHKCAHEIDQRNRTVKILYPDLDHPITYSLIEENGYCRLEERGIDE